VWKRSLGLTCKHGIIKDLHCLNSLPYRATFTCTVGKSSSIRHRIQIFNVFYYAMQAVATDRLFLRTTCDCHSAPKEHSKNQRHKGCTYCYMIQVKGYGYFSETLHSVGPGCLWHNIIQRGKKTSSGVMLDCLRSATHPHDCSIPLRYHYNQVIQLQYGTDI
jgi:hypothetical protein